MIWLIFEIFETIFFPNIKMYTFFHHKNDEEKWLAPKMKKQLLFKIYPIHIVHPVLPFSESKIAEIEHCAEI